MQFQACTLNTKRYNRLEICTRFGRYLLGNSVPFQLLWMTVWHEGFVILEWNLPYPYIILSFLSAKTLHNEYRIVQWTIMFTRYVLLRVQHFRRYNSHQVIEVRHGLERCTCLPVQ